MVSKLYQQTDLNSSYKLNAPALAIIIAFLQKAPIALVIGLAALSTLSDLHAQKSVSVTFSADEINNTQFTYLDSADFETKKLEILASCQIQGFLTAHILDISADSSQMSVETGRIYKLGQINHPAGFERLKMPKSGDPFDPKFLSTIADTYLKWLENRGHPFASATFVNPKISNDIVDLSVKLERGPFIAYDSVVVKSSLNIPSHFFQTYLDMKSGDAYSEKVVAGIHDRLDDLPYLSVTRPPEVAFHPNRATTYLYFDAKNANRFNGIIGIQQNEDQDRASIVGQVELQLLNALRRGERLTVDWQRFQAESQTLDIDFSYPFVLKSHIGLSGALSILRQDSTYSSSNARAGVLYQFSGLNAVSAFIERSNTSDLSPNDDFGSAATTSYGLHFDFAKLDRRLNPRSGIDIRALASTGTRSAPDTSDMQSTQVIMKYSLGLDAYLPLGDFFSVRMGAMGTSILGDALFNNELQRIGGFSTLRGFDEASIFSSSHAIGTAELRFDFDELSNVFLFVDQAWYEKNNSDEFVTDTPTGLGLGASLGTAAGIFQISYAIGQQFENPLLIRNAKLHFGFVSIF